MKEEKKATRQSYGEALLELGRKNKNIVVLDADLGRSDKNKYILQKNFQIDFLIWE